ncbi:MAG: hypothetical protein ACPGXK_12355 [Phycisphaerae bacterium]
MANGIPPAYPTPQGSRPWSTMSIAAFIMSFTVCLSPVALPFGIAGIIRTSSGTRKGLPLAIASIPISLAGGVMGFLMVFVGFLVSNVVVVAQTVEDVLAAELNAEAVESFRSIASDQFNAAVSDEAILAWLTQVRAEQGKLAAELPMPQDANTDDGTGITEVQFEGRFVNGNETVEVSFTPPGFGDTVHLQSIRIGNASLP